MARELESSVLDLFMPCPSSASHRNRGKYLLKPGPMTYPEEKLLQFLGQVCIFLPGTPLFLRDNNVLLFQVSYKAILVGITIKHSCSSVYPTLCELVILKRTCHVVDYCKGLPLRHLMGITFLRSYRCLVNKLDFQAGGANIFLR